MLRIELSLNARSPKLETTLPSSNVTVVNDLHEENADPPMLVTVLGISN